MSFAESDIFSDFKEFKILNLKVPMRFLVSLLTIFFSISFSIFAQPDRWQQRVQYKMDIDMEVATHQFTGKQTLKYFNNSPDTLYKVYYHLYFNAFQPGSMMDWQNRDPLTGDSRVRDRIANLKPEETGWHKVESLTCNGKPTSFEVKETILEVTLTEPILPKSVAEFRMQFQSQVPIQIRRSGRDSRDGVAYSMSQWYPKLAEYDYKGWNLDLYVGREFYGVWGDFDVNISIDRSFILGASGSLQNANEIGYGYEPAGAPVKQPAGDKLTWHWKAENVHDFSWVADPDYKHVVVRRPIGPVLHFLYQPKERTQATWEAMPAVMDKALDYIEKNFGEYPYSDYSFLEAGDGGMEYPMATFLRAGSGVGTFIHEWMHAWFYGTLGNNEGKYPWMDEGFTEFATDEVLNWLKKEELIKGTPEDNPHISNNKSFISYILSNVEEPLSTHHDHYLSSRAGGVGAYVKGHVLLTQLDYIMGDQNFRKGMLDYYKTWRFKHPNPDDFFRVMERASGMELDWFQQYFVFSTKQMDYGISAVEKVNRQETAISLDRPGHFPMPLDLVVTLKDGSQKMYNIPLYMMWGSKPSENPAMDYEVLKPWGWTIPGYNFTIETKFKDIVRVEIDPSQRMVDVNRDNNVWEPTANQTNETEGKE